jgi:hypothetical protein
MRLNLAERREMTAEEKATRLYMKELAILETAAASKYGDPKTSRAVCFGHGLLPGVNTSRVGQWAAAGVKRELRLSADGICDVVYALFAKERIDRLSIYARPSMNASIERT